MNTTRHLTPLSTLNPLPIAIEDIEEAGDRRRIYCRNYDRCLDIADRQKWPGFACTGCTSYRPMSAEEERAKRLAILELLATIRGGDVFGILHGEEYESPCRGERIDDEQCLAVLQRVCDMRDAEVLEDFPQRDADAATARAFLKRGVEALAIDLYDDEDDRDEHGQTDERAAVDPLAALFDSALIAHEEIC